MRIEELAAPKLWIAHLLEGSTFDKNVRNLLVDQDTLSSIVLPMLEAWRDIRIRAAELGRQLVAAARKNAACQILMSIPGVGAITATSFVTAIEDLGNFKKSRSVGAWLGLTTRRYQSGEVDYDREDNPAPGAHLISAKHLTAQKTRQHHLNTGNVRPASRATLRRSSSACSRLAGLYAAGSFHPLQPFNRRARSRRSIEYPAIPVNLIPLLVLPMDGKGPAVVSALRSKALFGGADQNSRIAVWQPSLHHVLVRLPDLVKRADFTDTGVDAAGAY